MVAKTTPTPSSEPATLDETDCQPSPDRNIAGNTTPNEATIHQPTPSATAPDPFDPVQFAANSSESGGVGITKEMVLCPVRKPTKQEFVRVHPSAEYQLRAHILELKDEREVYLVMPAIAAELPGETRTVLLRLAANRQGSVFLWPVPEPSADGRETGWGTTARTGAAKAEDSWVRLIANMSQGGYDVFRAAGVLGTPVWPEKSMRDILSVAFGENFIIRDGGHPVIKRLLGHS